MSNNLILEKLEGVKNRFEEVGRLITQPDVISDMKRYIRLNKEYKDLEPIIAAYKEYKNLLSNISSAKQEAVNPPNTMKTFSYTFFAISAMFNAS